MTAKVLYVFFLIKIFSFDGCFSQDPEENIIRSECAAYCLEPPWCPYGYEFDYMGCPTCTCRNPCSNYTCPIGKVCLTGKLLCNNPSCETRPTCVCIRKCLYGYETGCRCRNPCLTVLCPLGEYCSVQMGKPVCTSLSIA